MSSPVRLIPLGGFGEIGKNMMLLEADEQLLLIDAGIAFPDEEAALGVDLLIPDFTYLRENADRLVAIVLTHGHEDHIGGLPYVLADLKAPIYGTALTIGFVKTRLREHKVGELDFHVVESGDILELGPFEVECIRVNHSIPGCIALGIHTPAGLIVHSADFKFDHTPIDNEVTDFAAFARLGDEGVRLLISDSTNIDHPGHTPSEALVGEAFGRIFPRIEGRIFVATFASQVHRLQQVFDVSAAHGRKVFVSGRSMERCVTVASELGYLVIPPDTRVQFDALQHLPPHEVTVLITGSQGEPVSGLNRLAEGRHAKLQLHPGDTVILSATPIPGNEATVWRMINELMRRGAQVIDHQTEMVHVSGHASREEIKLLFNLIRPEFGVPFHGEYRHMVAYGELAQAVGLSHRNIFLLQNGDVLRLDEDGATLEDPVRHGVWTIDGMRINELGLNDNVAQDRVFLAQSGVITAAVSYDFAKGEAIAPPLIGTRGVRSTPDDPEGEALRAGAAEKVWTRLVELELPDRLQRAKVERACKRALRSYFEKQTGTYPVMQVLVTGLNEDVDVTPEPEPTAEPLLSVEGAVDEPLRLTAVDLQALAGDRGELPLNELLTRAGLASGAVLLTIGSKLTKETRTCPLRDVRDTGRLTWDAAAPAQLTLQAGDGTDAELTVKSVVALTIATVERGAD